MKNYKEELVIVSVAVSLILALYVYLVVMKPAKVREFTIAETSISTELDITSWQKHTSLAHGNSKANSEASLIINKDAVRYEISQAVVTQKISVMLFDSNGTYIELVRLVPLSNGSKPITYKSNNKTQYALEFPEGHPLMSALLRGRGPVRLPVKELPVSK